MYGIDLNQPILLKCASYRYFEGNEYHISRTCPENVLVLVFDGTLRFTENGKEREVGVGEYYIQEKNVYQGAGRASDAPKYLYVHFDGEWSDSPDSLSRSGSFDFGALSNLFDKLDLASHNEYSYVEQQYLFLKLLLSLKHSNETVKPLKKFIDYIDENIKSLSSLSDLCEAFHYSKNYVIRIFQKELGTSPIQYINDLKIKRAMYLLETTSMPIGKIAEECGYEDYPYFYKRFVNKTLLSPTEWRKAVQQNPLERL